MGLDMYLYRGQEERVAYWRKANHIHKWFIDHCQGGEDDCRDAPVSRDQLRELVNLCKQVLDSIETVEGEVWTGTSYYPGGHVEHHTKLGPVVAQQGLAKKLLPTQGGFFFGGTDYDEYYIESIKDTIKMIEPLLSVEGEYYYHSSW